MKTDQFSIRLRSRRRAQHKHRCLILHVHIFEHLLLDCTKMRHCVSWAVRKLGCAVADVRLELLNTKLILTSLRYAICKQNRTSQSTRSGTTYSGTFSCCKMNLPEFAQNFQKIRWMSKIYQPFKGLAEAEVDLSWSVITFARNETQVHRSFSFVKISRGSLRSQWESPACSTLPWSEFSFQSIDHAPQSRLNRTPWSKPGGHAVVRCKLIYTIIFDLLLWSKSSWRYTCELTHRFITSIVCLNG